MATAEELYGRDIAFKADLVVSATGDIETLAGLDNVKDALFRRLVTTPGTLIHRPNYGVGIKSFQNRLNSIAAQRELAQLIVEQFSEDERVEKVNSLSVQAEDNSRPEMVRIIVKVSLVGYGEQEIEFLPFEGG